MASSPCHRFSKLSRFNNVVKIPLQLQVQRCLTKDTNTTTHLMINAGENTARLAKWLTVSSSPRPKNQSPLGVGGRKGGNTSRKPTRGEQLATRREEKGVCSMLFPPEGAAPPNSSPKRGLTCMHSPSPPDPRWSRRIACVSPPPTSVVCSASPPPPA